MALAYTTGTINQPDAGSVGQAMVEKIRDDVVAHAAWELVEEFTPASGTQRFYVFKCLSGVSGLPKDFHIVIGRVLSTGELRLIVGEDYNAGSHSISKYGHTSGSVAFDADGCSNAAFTLAAGGIVSSGTNPMFHTWTPSGTSTKWWIIMADDGFTVAFNGPSNSFFHVGAYVPLTQLPILVPVHAMGYSSGQGVITRNPAVAGITETASALQVEAGGSSPGSNGPVLGFQGDLRYNDKLQNNQRPMAEQGIVIYDATRANAPVRGWVVGKQKRMRISTQSTPPGFAFGDAYAMSGRLWVPFKPDDGRVWDTGVASS